MYNTLVHHFWLTRCERFLQVSLEIWRAEHEFMRESINFVQLLVVTVSMVIVWFVWIADSSTKSLEKLQYIKFRSLYIMYTI